MSGTVIRLRPLDDAPVAENGNGHRPVPTIGGRLVDPERISAEVEEMGAQEAIEWAVENWNDSCLPVAVMAKVDSYLVKSISSIGMDELIDLLGK